MGLTIHFKLTTPEDTTETRAKNFVMFFHDTALRFQREGLVDKVHPITSDAKTMGRFACDWIFPAIPGRKNCSANIEILPTKGFIFGVSVGRDCEPLWLGLCQYPPTVWFQGRELPVKNRAGWRLSGFSKTQYASLHGWEHFQRCHCAVVNLLAACRSPGLRVKISDEGDYWPRRSLGNLRRNLDEMNGLVAATAGVLKDSCETADGKSDVESPIFAHKHFERLEAQGAERVAPVIKKLRAAIAKR